MKVDHLDNVLHHIEGEGNGISDIHNQAVDDLKNDVLHARKIEFLDSHLDRILDLSPRVKLFNTVVLDTNHQVKLKAVRSISVLLDQVNQIIEDLLWDEFDVLDDNNDWVFTSVLFIL
jgi:hypothetical protein